MLSQQFDINAEVIKYSAEQRELHGSLFLKALKFVKYDCIHYISDKHIYSGEGKAFVVLPLNSKDHFIYEGYKLSKTPFERDYNFTAYVVTVTYNRFTKENFLHCNCQGWKDKDNKGEVEPEGVMCSHALALKLFWKRQFFERKLLRCFYEE